MAANPATTHARGLPVRSPEALARWQARLRWWTFLLMLGTAVALGLIVEASLILPPRLETVLREDRPAAAAEEAAPPASVKQPAPAKVPAAAPLVQPAKPAGPTSEQLVQVLTDQAAMHLYQAHLNIGLLADAMEHRTYPEAQTRQHLERVGQVLERADAQLAAAARDGLPAEELKKLGRARQVLALVRTEVAELRAYWHTGEPERAQSFQNARKDAAAAINELLGIV
jgi:hypothetical protein